MDELRCNSLPCRKSLAVEGTAVVTTCSHIFCIECANALFSTPQVCPACETSLPDLDDVAQMTFNPHDSWKTSILSGMSPATILDIASRALNFYTYEVQQEGAFQALITKNAQERIAVLESQCNTITRDAHAEIRLLKDRVKAAEEGLALERRRAHELQETHRANAKAYSKLKAQYDKAKQRALLQPGDAAAFPAALHGAGVGSTPAHTPRVGSTTARQTFVAGGAHPQQQGYRPTSTLSHAQEQQGGGASWTPHGPSHAAGPYAPSSASHPQQQHSSSRTRRTLVPDPHLHPHPQQQQQQRSSGAFGAGRFSNASGSGSGGGRTPGSAGSADSGGRQERGSGTYGPSRGSGGGGDAASGFLGQQSAGGGGFGGGGGRGGFRPAQR